MAPTAVAKVGTTVIAEADSYEKVEGNVYVSPHPAACPGYPAVCAPRLLERERERGKERRREEVEGIRSLTCA